MTVNFFTGVCYQKPSLMESFGSGVDRFFSGSTRAYVIRTDGKQRFEVKRVNLSLISTALKIAVCVYFPKLALTLFCMKVLFRLTHSFSDGPAVVVKRAPSSSYYFSHAPSNCYPSKASFEVPTTPGYGHQTSSFPRIRRYDPPTGPGLNVPTKPTDRW